VAVRQSQLEKMVAQRLEGKGPDDYFFHELKGNTKSLPKMFTRFRDKVYPELRESKRDQSPKTLHSFRHFWITERIRAGCPPHLVSECAGHKSKGITLSVYHHGMTEEQAREIVEAAWL
jgi:integrase